MHNLIAGPLNGCLQGKYRELWLESVRSAFSEIDVDGSGYIEQEELVAYLADRLSPYEVTYSHGVLLPVPHVMCILHVELSAFA